MRIIQIVLLILISKILVFSQLNQIIVLNEGSYDYINQQILVPVSIGSFDPSSGVYTQKNIISGARFASDIIVDQNSYWVAADKRLINYDLKKHDKIRETIVEGIRKIAVYNDLIIVTRGEYQKTFQSYVQIYNKYTFELIYEVPFSILPYTAENIVIDNGYAFVAVNNGFEFGKEVGKIAKINLANLSVENIFDLGTNGKNPENLMLKDNILITLNNKDFTGSSISLLSVQTNELATYDITNVSSLCGTSTLVGDNVVYQEIGKSELGAFSITTRQSSDLKNLGISYYGITFDPVSKFLIAGQTDFRTTGVVYVYDQNFNELYKFNAGITPGYFAFDHNNSVKVHDSKPLNFELSPNPIITKFKVISNEPITEVSVMDLFGRRLITSESVSVNLDKLQSGTYILMVRTKEKVAYKRFVKLRI